MRNTHQRHQKSNNNNNGNNNRFRRNNNNNNNNRGRNNNGRYQQDEDSNIVTPQQRRHASNQQNKYLDMAKNARQNNERVEYEFYMQHVEHYTRILNLADEQQRSRDDARQRSYESSREEDASFDGEGESDDSSANSNPLAEEETTDGQEDVADAADIAESGQKLHPRRRHQRRQRVPLQERNYHSQENSAENHSSYSDDEHTQASPEASEADGDDAPRKRRGRPKKQSQAEHIAENSGASLQHVLPMAKMD